LRSTPKIDDDLERSFYEKQAILERWSVPELKRQKESAVQDVLHTPDEVRQSRSDPAVFLFYRAEVSGRWVCAVAKRLNEEGFLITTYPTDAIKEGERVWSR
jgi:hypothetical protein